MAGGFQVMDWRTFQHYKGRSPPWVKLHRSMLDNQRWRALSPQAAKLLIDLWMVASEGDRNGRIEHDSAWLSWRLRLASRGLEARLQELVKANWIRDLGPVASEPLADGKQVVPPEQSRADQSRTEGTCDKCGKKLRVNGSGRLALCVCETKVRV